jgi:hypothetical protein
MRYAMGLLLTVCLAWPAAGLAGENLVPQPTFKDGLPGWITSRPNTQYYGEDNAKRISLASDPKNSGRGTVLLFTMPQGVGDVEGVTISSVMFPVKPYAKYEFGVDVYSSGPAPIVFIEAYKKDEERDEEGPDLYPGYVRVYRATIHVKNAQGNWAPQSRKIDLSTKAKRYQPDFFIIKLYAYLGAGKIYWANPYVRMTAPPPENEAAE